MRSPLCFCQKKAEQPLRPHSSSFLLPPFLLFVCEVFVNHCANGNLFKIRQIQEFMRQQMQSVERKIAVICLGVSALD